jgi:hypothetical protein
MFLMPLASKMLVGCAAERGNAKQVFALGLPQPISQ